MIFFPFLFRTAHKHVAIFGLDGLLGPFQLHPSVILFSVKIRKLAVVNKCFRCKDRYIYGGDNFFLLHYIVFLSCTHPAHSTIHWPSLQNVVLINIAQTRTTQMMILSCQSNTRVIMPKPSHASHSYASILFIYLFI